MKRRRKPEPALIYEGIIPNRRSRTRHLFHLGPGQGDAALCGVILEDERREQFETTTTCRTCLARKAPSEPLHG